MNITDCLYNVYIMQILMIDAPPLFRDYLKDKLTAEKITIDFAQSKRDATTKMLSTLPDLVLIDADKYLSGIVELMEKKFDNPNTSGIPTIITGPAINSDTLMDLMHLGVSYYFAKPIQFDTFYEAISKICRIQTAMDKTPCTLETHINGNLVFIEISQGLNRDKLSLLRYRLADLVSINNITTPKIVLLMAGMSLSFVDGYNLELLLNSIISTPHLQRSDVRILTTDPFTRELVSGHSEYDGIKVDSNIITILNSLVDSTASKDINDLITEKILLPEEEKAPCIVDLRTKEDFEERRQVIEAAKQN